MQSNTGKRGNLPPEGKQTFKMVSSRNSLFKVQSSRLFWVLGVGCWSLPIQKFLHVGERGAAEQRDNEEMGMWCSVQFCQPPRKDVLFPCSILMTLSCQSPVKAPRLQ